MVQNTNSPTIKNRNDDLPTKLKLLILRKYISVMIGIGLLSTFRNVFIMHFLKDHQGKDTF